MLSHLMYTSLYLLTPNSQSFPPSPMATAGLFSMPVSLFLFVDVYLCHIFDSALYK